MNVSQFAARARRALRKSPRYLARRGVEAIRSRTQKPWSALLPHLVSDATLLRATGAPDIDALWASLMARPFFLSPKHKTSWAQAFEREFPSVRERIISDADGSLRHEFDLLGSGPTVLGREIPWLTDFKTGRTWPLQYCRDIQYNELDRPTDVKVPWELSRCQHFVRLGQAYWLTGDERYAREFASETTDWSASNPFCRGVNWACAMDVALRAVSWIWGFHFFADAHACRDPGFRSAFLRALFLHGEFIVKFLEKGDLNGNHYLCDGVGLVFLGLFFARTPHGRRWLSLGRSIVEGEILK